MNASPVYHPNLPSESLIQPRFGFFIFIHSGNESCLESRALQSLQNILKISARVLHELDFSPSHTPLKSRLAGVHMDGCVLGCECVPVWEEVGQ